MEMIPIILIVLEVVAALTILTLIISYISFKIKQKNVLPGNEKANISNLNPNIRKSAKLHNKLKDNERNAAHLQSTNHRKDEKKYSSRNATVKPHKKDKPANPKTRLEVIKQLSANQTNLNGKNREEPKNRTNDNLQSLNDDVIKKYSDSDQHKMFTLHVKDNKDNKDNKDKSNGKK